MRYGPSDGGCSWCGRLQCFGRCAVTGASGDENPLSGPLIGPSWDVRSESPVKRLENAIQRGTWKPMSSEELGLISHVVLPKPAQRFLSRFRTRRH